MSHSTTKGLKKSGVASTSVEDIILFSASTPWIILGAIYIPWAILWVSQKISGLFSYMEMGFSAKIYSPNIY